MKKNKDLYADYKHDKYAHFRNVPTGEYEKQKTKSAKAGARLRPITKKVKVSFDEVKELRLDSFGTVAPTLDTEDFTIVSNYLVDFWGAIMGDSVVSTYLHLKRYAYGKKDYCYIDIEMIALKMGKSKNPVKEYLKTLEEYGFIAIFHRKDVTRNNNEVSPLFKIRRYIPLITKEMYDSLHTKLQKLHDEFLEEYEDITFNSSLTKTNDVIEGIVSNGEVINNKEMKEKIERVIKEGQLSEFVLHKLNNSQLDDNEEFHKKISQSISKPSYDTWFKDSISFEDNGVVTVLASNEFSRDAILGRHKGTVKDIYCSVGKEIVDVDVHLIGDYIRGNLNRA